MIGWKTFCGSGILVRRTKFITLFFKSLFSSFQNRSFGAWQRGECVCGGGVVMPRRPRETLQQVRSRLTREQAERTRKRVEELLVQSKHETCEQEQAEEESEVRQLLCQSRQLLREVEEERKGTIRVSLCCCYCIVCCVVCIVFCLISVLTLVVRQQQTDNGK